MVKEKLISKEEAIGRVLPDHIDQMLHPMIDPKQQKTLKPLGKGLNASPGAACGQIVFNAKDAEAQAKEGKKVLLVRKETSPEDIGGMAVAQGILTCTGGMTSHAAVVARGMGKPCVAGAQGIRIDVAGKTLTIGDVTYAEGDVVTLDGTTGNVYGEALDLIPPQINEDFEEVLGWADEVRRLLREQLEHLDAPDEIDIELVALVHRQRMGNAHRRDDRLSLIGGEHREQHKKHEQHRDGQCDEQTVIHAAQP